MKFSGIAIPNTVDSGFFIETLEPDISIVWNGRL
jgi:hypothetical protein